MAGIDENIQNPNATCLAKIQTARAPDGETKAGSKEMSVPESPNDQADPVVGKRVSGSVWRKLRRKKKKAYDVTKKLLYVNEEKKRDVNRSKDVLALAYGANTSPQCPFSFTITNNNNQNHQKQFSTVEQIALSTDSSAQAQHIQHRGTMSTAGSTRGHGGSHRGNFNSSCQPTSNSAIANQIYR